MIELMPESRANILGFRVEGRLTDDDYKGIFKGKIEETLEKTGSKIKAVLFLDESFEGWEKKEMWEADGWGTRHRNDFEKLALVCSPRWIDWGVKIDLFFREGSIKAFGPTELTAAWEWLKD